MVEPPVRRSRIGVFGGTFDPVHIGHLVAALDTRVALGLDRMLLVPANVPWQKVGDRAVTPAPDRLAMLRAAVDGVEGLDVSTVDIDRGGATYTADTLADLSAHDPHAAFFLVVGADVARELNTWVRPHEIRQRATLAVVDRGHDRADGDAHALRAGGWRVEHVRITALEVSSSDVRCRMAEGRPIDFLVPPGAIRVIEERHLYARRR